MYRLLNFLRKFLFKDTLYCLYYLFFLKQKRYREKARFLSHAEFLRQADEKSTIRFGDGEIGLLHYSQIHYQKFDPELRLKLLEIIKNYTADANYLIGLPLYTTLENTKAYEISKEKIFLWMPVKITFRLLFNKKMKYFDQHIFYRHGKAKEFFLEKSKDKKVVIVTRKETLEAIKSHPVASSIPYLVLIESPGEHAFDCYLDLESDIRKAVGTDTKNCVVFLGCGPAGKVIAYDLSKEGILCHDIGLGVEMMLTDENYEYKI